MKSAIRAVFAVVLAAVGLQIFAQIFDFSTAVASTDETLATAGGNRFGGGTSV